MSPSDVHRKVERLRKLEAELQALIDEGKALLGQR